MHAMFRSCVHSLFLIVLLALAPTVHELGHADDHGVGSQTTLECAVCDQFEAAEHSAGAVFSPRHIAPAEGLHTPRAARSSSFSGYSARAPPLTNS